MSSNTVALASLANVIESLQDTIRRDGKTVGANETRTRNTLIDPLLRALGWSDPSVLTPEYLVRYGAREFDYGVVDYALHAQGQRASPIAFIEAKRMREALTDDHRDQVFSYAQDKADTVKFFALTNGDCWELYQLLETDVRIIFDISIRNQAPKECARLFLHHFPTPTMSGGVWSQNRVDPPTQPSSNPVTATPKLKTHDSISQLRLFDSVDIPKVLTWFCVLLVTSFVVSYIIGVWAAQPVTGFYAKVGLVALPTLVILAAALAWRFLIRVLGKAESILRLHRLFSSTDGDRRKTLQWIGVAIVGGSGIGGGLGYFIGSRTAQSIIDSFASLGEIIFWVLIGLLICCVMLIVLSGNSGRRSPRRWKR